MKNWPLWEIFIRSKQGLHHKHVGSLHAADAQMAIENARDVYTRRNEGVSIWVVESDKITASNPEESAELFGSFRATLECASVEIDVPEVDAELIQHDVSRAVSIPVNGRRVVVEVVPDIAGITGNPRIPSVDVLRTEFDLMRSAQELVIEVSRDDRTLFVGPF